MRLEYSVSRFDLFRAQARALLLQRVLWALFLPLVAITWWSSFSWQESRNQPTAVRIITATITALACAAVGAVGGCAFLALQSLLRRDKGVLGSHTLEITEEGLLEFTDVNRSLTKWAGMFRIRETPRYIYIYVSETNFHLVPRQRLVPPGSLDEFVTELRARITRFQQSAPPNGGPSPPVVNSGVSDGPPSVS
jgi:hypothetical protein